MSLTVTVEEAQASLESLLQKLKSTADEIVISVDGQPIARLTAIPARAKERVPGSAKGQFTVPPEFFDPLPPEIEDAFYQ